MAAIVNSRDLALQSGNRLRYIRDEQTFNVSTRPWTNLYNNSIAATTLLPRVLSNSVKDPTNGNAYLYVPTVASAYHDTYVQQVNLSNNVSTVQQAFYVKNDPTGNYNAAMYLGVANAAHTFVSYLVVDINPITGVASLTNDSGWSLVNIAVSNQGDGWWKLVVKATYTKSTNETHILSAFRVTSGGSPLMSGNGTSGVYIYGMQLYLNQQPDEKIGDTWLDSTTGTTYTWNGYDWTTTSQSFAYIELSASTISKSAVDAGTDALHTNVTGVGKVTSSGTVVTGGFLTVTANNATESNTATPNTISTNIANDSRATSFTFRLYNQAEVAGATLLDVKLVPVVYQKVPATNISGNILGTQIADLAASKVTGQIVSSQLQDGIITMSKLFAGLEPPLTVTTLPTTRVSSTVFFNNRLHYWNGSAYTTQLPAADITGVLTDAQLSGIAATKLIGQVVSTQIADGAIAGAKIATGLELVANSSAGSLPTTFLGNLLRWNQKLYRWNGSAYTSAVPATDVTGQLTNSQIADIAANKLTGEIVAAQIAAGQITASKIASGLELVANSSAGSLPTTYLGNLLRWNQKLYRWNGSSYTAEVPATDVSGQLTNSQIADIAASKLTGQVVSSQIADGQIVASKIASGLELVSNSSAGSLPTTFLGNLLRWNQKLYRWTGSAYTSAVPATDVSGQLTNAQIADIAATKLIGQVVDSQIATLGAAKITGQLVDSQLAGISANKLSGQVTSAQIQALEAAKLAGQITGTQITDSAVTTAKIAAGAVVANSIAAGSIVASKLLLTDADSVFPDPLFDDAAWWNHQSGGVWPTGFLAEKFSTWPCNGALRVGPNTAGGKVAYSKSFSIEPLASYRVKYFVWISADFAGEFSCNVHFPLVQWYAPASLPRSGFMALDGQPKFDVANIPRGGWVEYEGIVTNPAFNQANNISNFRITADMTAGYVYIAIRMVRAANANLIVDGAIAADKIAANAVTAVKIAAGSVVAEKIAANAITADKILAGAVTTDKMIANSISGDRIAANTLNASKIVAGSITTDRMTANSIHGDRISAGTIAADKIVADSITAAQIAAGAITASEIAAKAVTASKIVLTDTSNLILDSNMEDPSAWSTTNMEGGAGTWSIVGGLEVYYTAWGSRFVIQIPANSAAYVGSQAIKVTPGEKFRVSGKCYNQAHGANVAAYIKFRTSDGGHLQWVALFEADVTAFSSYEVVVTAPPGAAQMHWVAAGRGNPNGYAEHGGVKIVKMNGASLIVDGTITTNHMTANSISGDRISAGSLAADKIVAGSISTLQLTSNAVTSDKIAAGAITAEKIAVDSITAAQIATGAITADEIAAGAITARKLLVGGEAGSSLWLDPTFADPTAYQGGGHEGMATRVTVTDGVYGSYAYQGGPGNTRSFDTAHDLMMSVTVGKTYRLSGMFRKSADSTAVCYLRLHSWTHAKVPIGQILITGLEAITPTTIWVRYSGVWVCPVGVSYVHLRVILNWNSDVGTSQCQDLRFEEMLPSTLIMDGAITTDKMIANSISGDRIAANTLNASKIVAGSITTDRMSANSIHGDRITGGTIAAEKLVADSITSAQIAAGAITAAEIAAGTITVNKLLVTPATGGFNPDPGFKDESAWGFDAGAWVYNSDASIGKKSVLLWNGHYTGTARKHIWSLLYSGAPAGKKIRLRVRGYNVSTLQHIGISCNFYDAANVYLDGAVINIPAGGVATAQNYSVIWDVPANADKYQFWVYNGDNTSGNWNNYARLTDLQMELAVTSELIVDGSITTDKMIANSISGDRISAGTLNASKIVAGSITTDRMTANSIHGDRITGGTIAADKIVANSLTASQIATGAITADELAAGSVRTNKLFITPAGLNPDPTFKDNTFWTYSPNSASTQANSSNCWYVEVRGDLWGKNSILLWGGSTPGAPGTSRQHCFSYVTEGAPAGKEIRIRFTCINSSNQRIYAGVQWFAHDGTHLGGFHPSLAANSPAQRISAVGTCPDGASKFQFIIFNEGGTAYVGHTAVSDLQMEIAASSELIVDGAVTTQKMVANSIHGDRIAAGTLTADKIVAGSITTDRLVAGGINGSVITGGTLNGDRIIGGTIFGDKLVAGTVTAAKIAVGAITASKLLVSPANICPDPTFQDIEFWSNGDSGGNAGYNWYFEESAEFQSRIAACWEGVTGATTVAVVRFSRRIKFSNVGMPIRLRARGRNSSNRLASVYVEFYNKDGGFLGNHPVTFPQGTNSPTTLTSAPYNVPAATTEIHFLLYLHPGPALAGAAVITDINMMFVSTSDLVVDGAITADKLAVNSVTAGKIVAGTITGDKIAANTITTSKLLLIPQSLCPDPSFLDIDFWSHPWDNYGSNGWYIDEAGNNGVGRNITLFSGAGGGPGTARMHVWSRLVNFSGIGQSLRLRALIYNESNQAGYAQVNFYNKDNGLLGGFAVISSAGSFFQDLSQIYTVPSGTEKIQFICFNQAGSTFSGFIRIGAVRLDIAASSELIVDGSILSSKIAADAVVAGKIAAGAINAREIAAGAITASRVTVVNQDNVHPDSLFYDPAMWVNADKTATAWPSYMQPAEYAGWPVNRMLKFTASGGTRHHMAPYFSLEKGASYRVKAHIYVTSSMTGTFAAHIHLPMQAWFDMGIPRSGTINGLPAISIGRDGWYAYTSSFTLITSSDLFVGQAQFRFDLNITAGEVYVAFQIVRMSSAELIVDGSITTNKMVANSIQGDRIAANSLSAEKIVAGSITADKLTIGQSQLAPATMLRNPDFTEFSGSNTGFGCFPGWAVENTAGVTGISWERNQNSGRYWNMGRGGAALYDTNTGASGEWGLRQTVSVIENVVYEFHCKGSAHRCSVRFVGFWKNASNVEVGTAFGIPTIVTGANVAGAGGQLVTLIWGEATAPAGAAFLDLYLVKLMTNAGQGDSWAFFHEVHMAAKPAGASATNPTAFRMPGMVQIHGGAITAETIEATSIKTNSINTDRLVVGSVTSVAAGTGSLSSGSYSSETTVLSTTINTGGFGLYIHCYGAAAASASCTVQFKVKINGTTVLTVSRSSFISDGVQVPIMNQPYYNDNPGSGDLTVSVTAQVTFGSVTSSFASSIFCLSSKR